MQSKDLQNLRQQIKKRQNDLKCLDDRIAEQLTKKQLLQDIYYDDIKASSSSSNSELRQDDSLRESKASDLSASASIDSSFLQDEIDRVRDYLHKNNANATVGETTVFTKQDNNMKKTFQPEKSIPSKYAQKYRIQQTNFSRTQRHETNQNKQLYKEKRIQNQEKLKSIKTLQEAKRKQLDKYLDQKQVNRQKEIQRQREVIRAELIRQNEEKFKKKQCEKPNRQRVNTIVYEQKNVSVYQIQRNRALTTLLKETQRESRRAQNILQRTRNLIYS